MLRRALIFLFGLWLGLIASALPSPAQSPPSGNTLTGPLNGLAPNTSTGGEGNFVIDSNTGNIWGPKSAGAWTTAPTGQLAPVPAPVTTGSQWYPIYSNTTLTAGTTAPSQNLARCAPFLWPWTSHVDKVAIQISTLGTGPLNFALYTDAIDSVSLRHQPQNPITNPNVTFTVTSTGTAITANLGTPGVGVPLTKGLDWACTNDTTAADLVRFTVPTLNTSSTALVGVSGGAAFASSANQWTSLTISLTAGTTAANWPTLAGQTMTDSNTVATPNFALEIATVP